MRVITHITEAILQVEALDILVGATVHTGEGLAMTKLGRKEGKRLLFLFVQTAGFCGASSSGKCYSRDVLREGKGES